MKDIKFELYTDKSIDFMFSESSKMLDETFKSFRESINKSFIVFAIYTSLLTYCYGKITDGGVNKTAYVIAFIGISVATIFILYNLMPGKMILSGTNPKNLLNEYFEHEDNQGENQDREMKITKIIDHETAINENIKMIKRRSVIFVISVSITLFSVIFSLFSTIR